MPKAAQSKTTDNEDVAAHKRLLEISRQLSATLGAEFFDALAKHLANALAANGVFVAEFLGGQMERYRSIGGWCDGAPAAFEHELVGSALVQMVLGRPCQWRSNARGRFPSDPLFQQTRAEACVAVPLLSDGKHAIGALIAIYRQPITSVRFPKAMLDIFSERAAAELMRKIEEEKLRESDQRYRAFIAKNADAMWRVEFEQPIPVDLPEEEQFERIFKYGYVAECNDALAHFIGAKGSEQLIGAGIDKIVSPKDPTVREATLVGIRAGYNMTSVETNPPDPSGRRRAMIRSQWGIVEDGHLKRMWGSSRDITDLRHTELALDASEQRMADLVESMRMFVLFLDLNGSIEFCNDFVFEMTKWPADELIGKEWLRALIPAAERSRVTAELERNTEDDAAHFESPLLANGSTLDIEWDSTVLRNSDGTPAARALVGRNITEQRALQEQMLQAKKLAGIGRLAGGLAHDFNNLLTVILGYTSKLLEGREKSDPTFSNLVLIQKAAERCAELAHRLLSFSRREIFRPQTLDLNQLLEDTRSLVTPIVGDEIRLTYNFAAQLPAVRVDPNQFQQIVLNLAANARDSMPEGGLLTIATATLKLPCEHLPVAGIPPGQYVLLTIADTGTGMSDEVKSHLFEPFFTTKEKGKGTGLGLAMAYGMVEQSSGFIRVDSEVGRGTTFRIFLPAVPVGKVPEESKPKRALPGGAETILLVEDPPSLVPLAQRSLRELGYTVWSADGPIRALEICRSESNIQLMVSPTVSHGMPGEVLLFMVKEFHPNIKGLFVSSGEEAPVSEVGVGATVETVPGPVSRKDLAIKVRRVLDRT